MSRDVKVFLRCLRSQRLELADFHIPFGPVCKFSFLLEVGHATKNLRQDCGPEVERAFLAIYTIELVLRVMANGIRRQC